jgi:tetratricopeptide (TPR) repeat protein
LERTLKLAPHAPAAEMVLAEIYNRLQLPERSRPLITHLREATNAPVKSSFDLDLALLDSYSWILQTNLVNARAALQSVVRQYPDDPQVANRVAGAYIAMGDLTNAMQLIEEQLTKTPEDVPSLNSKAMILMQWGQSATALPILDHILTLTNLPATRMNRVFAHIALRDFASAKSELKALEQPDRNSSGMVAWGLAVVAEHEFDTNAARHYLQLCLSNAPPGGTLWQQAVAQLRGLEPAAPVK